MNEQLSPILESMTASTVEVRLRHFNAERGCYLGHFSVFDLQRLMSELNRWVVYDEDGVSYGNSAEGILHGSFNAQEGAAYFEIVLSEDT